MLGELVEWLRDFIDNADIGNRRPEIERIFRTTLRYEYRFWQSGYHGEEWGLMGLRYPLYPVDPCKTSGLSKDLTK